MDHLDLLAEPAGALLARVDDVLSRAGAPLAHPVWPPLRRVGVLPGAAAGAVVALDPAAVDGGVPSLRAVGRDVDLAAGSLPAPDRWSGAAAEAYDATRARIAAGIGGLADGVDATADFADAVAAWMRESRRALAVTLAEVLTSREAISVLTDDAGAFPPVQAAADIAERVLRTVVEVYAGAEELLANGPRPTPAR